MNNEQVCCVILNYNDSSTTLDLLERIKDYNVFKYILIVDNCSTDDSLEKLQLYQSDRILVSCTDYNGGYGYGNNWGVKYALNVLNCEYVLIANPDVSFNEETVESLLNILKKDERCAVSTTLQLDSSKHVISKFAWKVPTISQYICTAECIARKFVGSFYYSLEQLSEHEYMEVECVPGSFLLVKAKLFIECGGYDEEMFLYCEETTLGFKVKNNGYKTILLTNSGYVHYHSVSINKSIKSKSKQYKMMLNSRYIFIKKYLKANCVQLFLTNLVYGMASFEYMLLTVVKK